VNPNSPRATGLLLAHALSQVDRIQPSAIRAPIKAMLLAGVEECVISTTLLGHQLNYLIELAKALIEAD
jgi:hypothetical protein